MVKRTLWALCVVSYYGQTFCLIAVQFVSNTKFKQPAKMWLTIYSGASLIAVQYPPMISSCSTCMKTIWHCSFKPDINIHLATCQVSFSSCHSFLFTLRDVASGAQWVPMHPWGSVGLWGPLMCQCRVAIAGTQPGFCPGGGHPGVGPRYPHQKLKTLQIWHTIFWGWVNYFFIFLFLL